MVEVCPSAEISVVPEEAQQQEAVGTPMVMSPAADTAPAGDVRKAARNKKRREKQKRSKAKKNGGLKGQGRDEQGPLVGEEGQVRRASRRRANFNSRVLCTHS